MVKRNKSINIKINLSNKLHYTILTLGVLIILSLSVYAYNSGFNDPSIMGHSYEELDLTPTDVKVTDEANRGNFGGYDGIHNWIQTNGCAGYHVCTSDEIIRWISAGNSLNGNGWYNTGISTTAYYSSTGNYKTISDCQGWTSDSDTYMGNVIYSQSANYPYTPFENPFSQRDLCNVWYLVFCCK